MLIYTDMIEQVKDFGEAINISKKLSAEFNEVRLNFHTQKKLIKNYKYQQQSNLSYDEDIENYKEDVPQKIKIFFVFYIKEEMKQGFQKHLQPFKDNNQKFYFITGDRMELIELLFDLVLDRMEVEDEHTFRSVFYKFFA